MVKSLEYTKINRNLGNLERVSSSKTANPFGRSTFPRVIVQPRLINSFLRILVLETPTTELKRSAIISNAY